MTAHHSGTGNNLPLPDRPVAALSVLFAEARRQVERAQRIAGPREYDALAELADGMVDALGPVGVAALQDQQDRAAQQRLDAADAALALLAEWSGVRVQPTSGLVERTEACLRRSGALRPR